MGKEENSSGVLTYIVIIMMAKEYSAKGLIWPLFSTAVFFLVFVGALTLLFGWLEKRLDGSDNYELVSADALAMSAGTYSHPSRKTPFDERSGEFGSGRPKGDY